MAVRGRGCLEIKPSDSPFFVTTNSDIGVNPTNKIAWAHAINPDFKKSSEQAKQETFAFLYTRESDRIGGMIAKPTFDHRPRLLTKTEFLKKWRENISSEDGENGSNISESSPERLKPDVEKILRSFKQGTKYEDPRYTTSSNEFGKKAPTVATYVSERANRPQGFSKSFNNIKPQNSGLSTGLSKSTVHPSLDPQFA